LLIGSYSERGDDPRQVFFAIIFNLDPSAFLVVMNAHTRPQMLLQSVPQIFNRD
jgi:hypothetical protein